jgi:hypothetical protein
MRLASPRQADCRNSGKRRADREGSHRPQTAARTGTPHESTARPVVRVLALEYLARGHMLDKERSFRTDYSPLRIFARKHTRPSPTRQYPQT